MNIRKIFTRRPYIKHVPAYQRMWIFLLLFVLTMLDLNVIKYVNTKVNVCQKFNNCSTDRGRMQFLSARFFLVCIYWFKSVVNLECVHNFVAPKMLPPRATDPPCPPLSSSPGFIFYIYLKYL